METDSYYSYHSNHNVACEGEPYEISDYEPAPSRYINHSQYELSNF